MNGEWQLLKIIRLKRKGLEAERRCLFLDILNLRCLFLFSQDVCFYLSLFSQLFNDFNKFDNSSTLQHIFLLSVLQDVTCLKYHLSLLFDYIPCNMNKHFLHLFGKDQLRMYFTSWLKHICTYILKREFEKMILATCFFCLCNSLVSIVFFHYSIYDLWCPLTFSCFFNLIEL